MRFTGLIFIISVLTLAFVSCSETCTENSNALPLAGFYASGDESQAVRVDSLTVRGIGAPSDSLLTNGHSSLSQVYLPFRIDCDTTSYQFSIKSGEISRQSNVTFIYSRTPRFVSVECGVSYIFDIKKIECTGNLIDSVVCPKGFIDNTNIENLKIYFATNQ